MGNRFLRNSAILWLPAAVILSGCAGGKANIAPPETSVQTFEATTAETVTILEISCFAEDETEVPENDEPEYVEVSSNNEFIDYEFIEDYQGTTDIGGLADKAVELVKSTSQYSESVENADKFSYDAIHERTTDEQSARERADKVAPYINGGSIQPAVSAAYVNDYDGDGKDETFIVVDMPYIMWNYPDVWNFIIYADSGGNELTVLDFYEGCSFSLLNYGKTKQLICGGWDSMHSYTSIYGVKDGSPVTLYDHCPGGYFRKTDCFLSAFGLQGTSDFMYFDTVALEYRKIKGVELSLDEMKELDVSGTLCRHCNAESLDDLPDYVEFHFIKPNYYLIDWGLPGSHLLTYENGVFTYDKDSNITRSSNYSKLDAVAEFDIDKAIAEMKKPKEPYVKVSPGNEFIDYEFIENYQGTTDIGGLADKAAEFLMTTEEYAECMEHIAEFTDKEGSDHFLPYIRDGKIVPKFNTAYPNDYDGDGRTETFIVVDMPMLQGNLRLIRSFFIFADSNENMTLLSDASDLYDTLLLDYGDFKQITFGGSGISGADDHIDLYGVVNGEAKMLYSIRGEFHKSNCFLSSFGTQGSGAFMYYDTIACEYRAVVGDDIPIDKIKEMDSTNELAEFYEHLEKYGYLSVQLVGGKYYLASCGAMDTGTAYLYENGKFIQTEECEYVRDSHFSYINNVVLDIDITKAIAEMKSVK